MAKKCPFFLFLLGKLKNISIMLYELNFKNSKIILIIKKSYFSYYDNLFET